MVTAVRINRDCRDFGGRLFEEISSGIFKKSMKLRSVFRGGVEVQTFKQGSAVPDKFGPKK